MAGLTPFQTVGPFFQVLVGERRGRDVLAGDGAQGTRITIAGAVFDGAGTVIPDALVEIWQADACGRYRHALDPQHSAADPAFRNFGRASTDADGRFAFETVLPGVVREPGPPQAPHILVSVVARGVLTRYTTRLYFDGDVRNADDPILQLVPAARRQTLMAAPAGGNRYTFDIRIQGAGETVFFDA
jgi:protocatechuate 3,4-dioxygenase alpha subunit